MFNNLTDGIRGIRITCKTQIITSLFFMSIGITGFVAMIYLICDGAWR